MTAAVRVDEASRVSEEAAFFGTGPDHMLGIHHRPLGPPRGAAVVCSPFQIEIMATYRWEVLLGRSLAQAGIAVQRFHYRGTGNSDGNAAELSFGRMVEDASTAAAGLEASGLPVAFAGAGFGGMVAAAAAARVPGAPLVLRGPAFDGKKYFRDAFRAHVVAAMREDPDGAEASPAELLAELESRGTVDVLGNSLPLSFYQSAVGRTLESELGTDPRPVLLLQANPGGKPTRAAAGFGERLRAAGFDIEVFVVPRMEAFLLLGGGFRPIDDMPETSAQLEAVAAWLTNRWDP